MILRLCAWAGLLAPITFTVGWIVGGLAQPDAYSAIDHSVSDLGAMTADSAWLYNQIGANLTGLLVIVLAVGLWRIVTARLSGRVGVIALGVVGLGIFLDGWLRLDCRSIDAGCDAGRGADPSWQASAHSIESLITILGLAVSAFALARAFTKTPRWGHLATVSLVAGIITVAGVVTMIILAGLDSPGQGLINRLALTVWFGWLALVAYRLLKVAHDQQPSEISTPA